MKDERSSSDARKYSARFMISFCSDVHLYVRVALLWMFELNQLDVTHLLLFWSFIEWRIVIKPLKYFDLVFRSCTKYLFLFLKTFLGCFMPFLDPGFLTHTHLRSFVTEHLSVYEPHVLPNHDFLSTVDFEKYNLGFFLTIQGK